MQHLFQPTTCDENEPVAGIWSSHLSNFTEVQRLSFVHFASRSVRHTGVKEGIRHSGLVLNLLYKESLELNSERGIFFFLSYSGAYLRAR